MGLEDFGRVWFGLVSNGLQRLSELQKLSGIIGVYSHKSPKAGVHGRGAPPMLIHFGFFIIFRPYC